jgi:hypothetical protein
LLERIKYLIELLP